MDGDVKGILLAGVTAFLSERYAEKLHYLPLDRRFKTLTIRGRW